MADKKNNGETPDLDQRDINNPRDRDALKRAADDFLKSRRADAMAEAAEDEALDQDWAQDEETVNPLAELQVENNALKDQVLRIAADMENLRKRTAREIHDARTYATTNFARDMLAVNDNLRRALDAIPADALAEDSGLKALAEGVEMTERSMLLALERHGVKELQPQGQRFDPNFHQAMFEVPNTEIPNNTVVEVVQSGYAIGDRVLRPAMVGVSRGGPKAAPTSGNDQAE